MGYYIETEVTTGKASYLVNRLGGKYIPKPRALSDIPSDKALIAVVQNGFFDAAALCYNQSEFEAFSNPSDSRHIDYVLLDKAVAHKEAKYNVK